MSENIVVTVGECRVEIREDRGTWRCRATLAGDYHLALSGKSYKTAKGAERAAEKWARETSARLAVEDAQAAAMNASEPEPAAPWMVDVLAAYEAGADVVALRVKL